MLTNDGGRVQDVGDDGSRQAFDGQQMVQFAVFVELGIMHGPPSGEKRPSSAR